MYLFYDDSINLQVSCILMMRMESSEYQDESFKMLQPLKNM